MVSTPMYRWEQISNMEESSCVIEFQAFRGNNDEFVVKELVILDVQSGVTNYFLFKQPFPFFNLTTKNAKTNKWLSKYFHHISWYEGFTDYSELENIMIQYCSRYKNIFSSGLEKCEFLSMYAPKNVTIYNICRQKSNCEITGICIGVRYNKHKILNCALSNAYNLKTMLQTNIKLSSGGGRVVEGLVGINSG